MNKKHRISLEVKDQVINRIKNEGVSVSQAATEHGLSVNTIYGWISRKAEGGPTIADLARLKRENQALKELVGTLALERTRAQKKI